MYSVAQLLGGDRVFRKDISGLDEMRETVRRGLPYSAFEHLSKILGQEHKDRIAEIIAARRTLARRRESRQFTAQESDLLYRIASTAQQAIDVFGSSEKAISWLFRTNRALRDATPFSLLDTEIGRQQVEEVLFRISYGIYS